MSRRPTRHGWVARRLLGESDSHDATLRDNLISGIAGALRPDGSVSGGFLGTVNALKDLVELGAPAATLSRPLEWLLQQQGKPGAFHEGCTAARHAHRVCEHFLAEFFAPAPPTQRVAPLTLPNGKTYSTETPARFALSCTALEAVLLAGRADARLERHLASFAHLLPEWDAWSDLLAPDLAFPALGALAAAPATFLPTAESIIALVAKRQQPDGGWPRVEFFAALDALGRVASAAVLPLLARALPALVQRQRDDGSFGSAFPDERALIGLRVMLRLARSTSP